MPRDESPSCLCNAEWPALNPYTHKQQKWTSYIYECIYIHTSNNNTIREREAINLRVGEHRKDLREEKEGESNVNMFQLKIYFKN